MDDPTGIVREFLGRCSNEIERTFLTAFFGLCEHRIWLRWPEVQYEIGGFVADFAWNDDNPLLVVEIDGHKAHKSKQQREHDYRRDRALERAGWHVMRFTGTEVYHEAGRCALEVAEWLRIKHNQGIDESPPHPDDPSPPRKVGGSLLP